MSDPSGNPPPDPYGQPGQYGQYPTSGSAQYGEPAQYGAPPPNYRGWAITSIVLGVIFFGLIGLILGIIATVQSGKVNQRFTSGDLNGAARASRTTRTLCIVTTVLEVIGLLLIIIVIASHGSTTS
jgi:hypothetical protein